MSKKYLMHSLLSFSLHIKMTRSIIDILMEMVMKSEKVYLKLMRKHSAEISDFLIEFITDIVSSLS